MVRGHTKYSGTTATVALLGPSRLQLAWVGDSRAVVGVGPAWGQWTCGFATEDHRPNLPEESARILQAGGTIQTARGARTAYSSSSLFVYIHPICQDGAEFVKTDDALNLSMFIE